MTLFAKLNTLREYPIPTRPNWMWKFVSIFAVTN